jgi:hypothetical protein
LFFFYFVKVTIISFTLFYRIKAKIAKGKSKKNV